MGSPLSRAGSLSHSTAQSQLRQLRFSFPDRGRQEYFVSAPGRLLLTASKAKTQPKRPGIRENSLFGLLLVYLKGEWNSSQWLVAAQTLQFLWVYVRNWTVPRQNHNASPSQRAFLCPDIFLCGGWLCFIQEFALGDNTKAKVILLEAKAHVNHLGERSFEWWL